MCERISAEHVKALNMIDFAFYGSRFLFANRRSKKERQVVDAWKEYFDHRKSRSDELFVNLLYAISRERNFDFDRVLLKRGIYSPRAHGESETEHLAIRKIL